MHDDNLIEEMCESFEAWFSDEQNSNDDSWTARHDG